MQKQWAAGAPVIGAASVPSEKPKRLFRMTGIMRVERSNFSLFRARIHFARVATRETRLQVASPPKGRQITNAGFDAARPVSA
jgi:hypothetical protein